ncbi:Pkinase-domain-containing protein [Trametopsis cervina]|nr:Pkinase-domain-containing protein [Trametopsis cervina]
MSDAFATSQRRYHDPKMIGLWKIGRTIGKGASGRVRIARHSKTGQHAAVKIVSKQMLLNSRMSMNDVGDEAERVLLSLEREIVIMKLIDHPNILRLYDVWETSTELYLILEYAEGGELFEYLCDKGPLSKTEALSHFQQIMTALDYCHRFNIAHRDLKPENILLDKNKNIKVADFGMAVWQGKSDMLKTACGSPHYAAPEIINAEPYNGTVSDVWSCGIILYALLTGRLPFDDEDIIPLLEKVRIGKFNLPTDMDPQAKDLISKMLEKDAKKRITVAEILKHPFYLSQPPKVMACEAPSLDQLVRPLPCAADIDLDILGNLRTLWRGISDEQLIDNLLNDKNTWDKAVYHLLVRYRDKHLENYDEDEEKLEKKRKAKQQKKSSQRRAAIEDLPPRAGPPTPSRAARRVAFDVDSPLSSHQEPESNGFRQITAVGSDIFSPELGAEEDDDFEQVQPPTPGYSEEVSGAQDDKIQYFWNQVAEHLTFLNAAGRPRSRGGEPQLPDIPSPPPLTLDLGTPFTVRKGTQNILPDEDTFKDVANVKETRPLSIRRRAEKENVAYLDVAHGPWPERKSSLKSNKTTATESSSARADRHINIVEPASTDLRKKRSILRPMMGSDYDADSPTSSDFSARTEGSSYFYSTMPRRNWLGNIFRFGPTAYQLLSTQDVAITRRECRKLLETMGVSVMLIQTEGMGVLKCKLPEAKDPAGVMATVKAVKFRVEMKIPTTVQAIAGFTVAMNIVMEKGANSSFKLVYSRLRREWDLDAAPIKCAMESRPEENSVEEVIMAA